MITREQQMQVWAAVYAAEYMRSMRNGTTGRAAELSAMFADRAVDDLLESHYIPKRRKS